MFIYALRGYIVNRESKIWINYFDIDHQAEIALMNNKITIYKDV
jgi:hypothetical protein